jgi:hypothetical protein
VEDFPAEGKAVSLVIDVSLRHDDIGVRLINTIKKQLTELVCSSFEEGVDALYLYHPSLIETLHHHGDQISAIGNYETDGWKFNVEIALKQALYVIASEDDDLKKYLVLITDRLDSRSPIDKALFINKKDRIDCHLVVVGIGDRYNKKLIEQALQDTGATHIHLPHPSQLSEAFLKEKPDVSKDICSQTCELCQ